MFEVWREEGMLTDVLVWKRIELAMRAGQTRLARYLGRFLEEAMVHCGWTTGCRCTDTPA